MQIDHGAPGFFCPRFNVEKASVSPVSTVVSPSVPSLVPPLLQHLLECGTLRQAGLGEVVELLAD